MSVVFAVRPFPQWLLPAAPFMALAAAPAVTRVFPAAAGRAALAFVVVVASSLIETSGAETRQAQLRVFGHVLAATAPGDVVLNVHREINLFRRDADWFWTCPHCLEAYRRVRPYDLDFAQLIREKEPALIHVQPGPGGTPRIKEHLDRSGAADHYERRDVEGWILYVRKRIP